LEPQKSNPQLDKINLDNIRKLKFEDSTMLIMRCGDTYFLQFESNEDKWMFGVEVSQSEYEKILKAMNDIRIIT
jgi:hypothetical protein